MIKKNELMLLSQIRNGYISALVTDPTTEQSLDSKNISDLLSAPTVGLRCESYDCALFVYWSDSLLAIVDFAPEVKMYVYFSVETSAYVSGLILKNIYKGHFKTIKDLYGDSFISRADLSGDVGIGETFYIKDDVIGRSDILFKNEASDAYVLDLVKGVLSQNGILLATRFQLDQFANTLSLRKIKNETLN